MLPRPSSLHCLWGGPTACIALPGKVGKCYRQVGQMGHRSPTGCSSSTGPYPSCSLHGKGLRQGLHAIVHKHGGVVEELLVAVLLSLDDEGVGHQRVPVVELVELHRNAIPVLELLLEQQLRVELEVQEVPTEVLDVVLNDDLDGLPWAGGERRKHQPGRPPQPHCCRALGWVRYSRAVRDPPDSVLGTWWGISLSITFPPKKVILPKQKWFLRKPTPACCLI